MSDIKDRIKAAQDQKREPVVVPEWDGITVYLRQLSAAEMDRWQMDTIRQSGKNIQVNLRNASAKFVGLCMVDELDARIFGDDEADELGKKSASVINRLFAVAQRLNGMTKEDVKEITGDFLGTQNISFTSS